MLITVTNNMGYQQITVLTAAVGLTIPPRQQGANFVENAKVALIRPQTQGIRWRDDGIDPTATTGMPLAAGETLEYDGQLSRFRMIEQAASAAVNVSYYS